MMQDVMIEAESCEVRPDYKSLARVLLDEINEFFRDPENEREYQEWLKEEGKGVEE